MTTRTNARIAGTSFLLYIAIGIVQMIVGGRISSGGDVSTRLANMAAHAGLVRFNLLLGFSTGVIALVLAVTLYALLRERDVELAMMTMVCRAAEGASVAVPMLATLGLLWMATSNVASPEPLANYLVKVRGWNTNIAATFFTLGSAAMSWAFVRGRMIPRPMAWLGVVASLALVVALPLQLVDVLSAATLNYIWIPMALFEIPLGFWLIFKGVR